MNNKLNKIETIETNIAKLIELNDDLGNSLDNFSQASRSARIGDSLENALYHLELLREKHIEDF